MKRLLTNILFGIIFILLTSCLINSKEGRPGRSFSLEDSKNREVFINEFITNLNYVLNDTFEIQIEHAWLEHDWTFKKDPNQSKIRSGEQIILETKNHKLLKSFPRNWSIISKDNYKSVFGKVGDHSLYISEPFRLDNFDFYVVTGWKNIHDSLELKKRLIGEFSLPMIDRKGNIKN